MRSAPGPTVTVWRDDDAGCLWVQWSTRHPDFEHIRDSFKIWFSGDIRWYPQRRAWQLNIWERNRLWAWAERHFDEGDITFQYGAPDELSGQRERRSRSQWDGRGGRASHSQSHTADPLTDAYAALHLLPSAPSELVQAAHRIAIRQAHPDAGGSHEAAVAVNAAMETIREAQRHAQRAS